MLRVPLVVEGMELEVVAAVCRVRNAAADAPAHTRRVRVQRGGRALLFERGQEVEEPEGEGGALLADLTVVDEREHQRGGLPLLLDVLPLPPRVRPVGRQEGEKVLFRLTIKAVRIRGRALRRLVRLLLLLGGEVVVEVKQAPLALDDALRRVENGCIKTLEDIVVARRPHFCLRPGTVLIFAHFFILIIVVPE
ncbi:hypothetical protein STCU_10939 [Strigomonas culicis]|uniref:Uncharacterized protein n=1 Tax=Strigomonas culicis TaxID=28005 RepID=S9V207_9TRYP|nr:hypothetical protein STCU_10939 [Strigomonas culicis]|eukprot:EPY16860.1 hypothetical protein STCU_10939 [Strigomonas culicis]